MTKTAAITFLGKAKMLETHQFVRDPSDFWHLVRAERESYLSEVVVHVVVAVQLYDQDQLPEDDRENSQLARPIRQRSFAQ